MTATPPVAHGSVTAVQAVCGKAQEEALFNHAVVVCVLFQVLCLRVGQVLLCCGLATHATLVA